MLDTLITVGTVVAAVGCGLIAGLFFVFSVFMMTALGRLPAPNGIAAMQSINTAIVNPVFLLVFLGTLIVCIGLLVAGFVAPGQPGTGWRIAGAVLYIVGAFLVTAIFNIPLNNQLDAVDPADPDGATLWARYRRVWTGWNHLRTVTSTGAATALTVALL